MFNSGVNTIPMKWRPRLKVWRSSNNVFDPEQMTAYSYGHWCYFRQIKGKNVFNHYYYSQATSGHQSELRQVLKQLKIKIHIEVNTRQSLESLGNALDNKYSELFQTEVASARKGIRKQTRKAYTQAIAKLQAEIKVLRSIGARLSRTRQSELKKHEATKEAYRLSELAKQREANREARKIRNELLENSFVNV